jgi:hypothetical protein
MKKIRLNVGELSVDSFVVPGQHERVRGTVHGLDDSVYCPSDPPRTCAETAYGMFTCDGYGSCDPVLICQVTHAGCV